VIERKMRRNHSKTLFDHAARRRRCTFATIRTAFMHACIGGPVFELAVRRGLVPCDDRKKARLLSELFVKNSRAMLEMRKTYSKTRLTPDLPFGIFGAECVASRQLAAEIARVGDGRLA